MATDLDRARQWIETRYSANDAERLVLAGDAPVFILVRTRLGCIWRFRADLPSDLVAELAKLAGREPAILLPAADAPPPERLSPLTRILENAGFATQPARELLAVETGVAIGDAYLFAEGDQASEGSGS